MHPKELLGEWVMWNLVSIRLDTVLVSMQDRCMVCAKRTIGSEMFWTHPMVLLGDKAHVEACFGTFGDSANLDIDRCMVCTERTIGSENRFGRANGTPT